VAAEPYGCFVWVRANASLPAVRYAADAATNRINVTLGPYAHGAVARVSAWGEDAAGNVGLAMSLTWEVDLTSPVTTWTPFEPPTVTNATTMLFSFGCSESVRCAALCTSCVFWRCAGQYVWRTAVGSVVVSSLCVLL
jgi:hypothetical protein